MHRRFPGFTLTELLVVMGAVSLVAIATTTIFIRASGVYYRTSAHVGPQSAQALALKRMESEMREAMFVSVVTPTPATWVEICLPKKDSSGANLMIKGAKNALGLERDPALDTSYFLGRQVFPNAADRSTWKAIPDPTGSTIFKALSSTKNADGEFPNAEVIIDGVLSTPMVPNPKVPGQEIPGRLFEYWPTDPTDTSRPSVNSQLVLITLSVPVQTRSVGRTIIENHTVKTQFCLRNWNTSQVP